MVSLSARIPTEKKRCQLLCVCVCVLVCVCVCQGSFAQVRVYALGLFAVLSSLKRESYTVPGRGLSIKLSTDPRVCLDYLPGSFTDRKSVV